LFLSLKLALYQETKDISRDNSMDQNRKWRCRSYTLPTYHGTTEGRDIQWYVLRFKMNAAEMDPPEERIVSCPTLFEKTFFQWPHERTQI